MKRLVIVLIVVLTAMFFVLNSTTVENDYLRLHIRANSDSEIDQSVKLKVRDAVLANLQAEHLGKGYLSKEEGMKVAKSKLAELESVVNASLKKEAFDYTCRVSLKEQYFPTRQYGDKVFVSGMYDAVVVELGEGVGENWWCVVYPPLCFLEGKDIEGEKIVYKSKIIELIGKYDSSS